MAKERQGEFFKDDAPHFVPAKIQVLHNVADAKVPHVDHSAGKWYGF